MIEQEPIVLWKTQDFLCFHHSKIITTITAEEECFEKGLISSQNKQTRRINWVHGDFPIQKTSQKQQFWHFCVMRACNCSSVDAFRYRYFYCLQSHRGPVNDLSTAVQLTNRLLRFWADGGFVYYKRVSSPSFLVSSQSLNNNIVVCNRAGWDKNWTDVKRKGGLQAVYWRK